MLPQQVSEHKSYNGMKCKKEYEALCETSHNIGDLSKGDPKREDVFNTENITKAIRGWNIKIGDKIF